MASVKHGSDPTHTLPNTIGVRSPSVDTKTQHTSSGSNRRPVATVPPWAKNEPESPTFDNLSPERSPRASGASTTRVPSIVSERPSLPAENPGGHHRWTFALPRQHPKPKRRRSSDSSSEHCSERGDAHDTPLKLSRTSKTRWPNSHKRISPEVTQTSQTGERSSSRLPREETLRLQLPLSQPKAPFTLSHSKTPGWNTPWTPRTPEQAYIANADHNHETDNEISDSQVWTRETGNDLTKEVETEANGLSYWIRTKKNIRSFLLHKSYIPLVSRLLNLTFTTITLALAIRIRIIEVGHHLRGAVGSSPVVAIIFAPLTLGHIMIAIYLEYLGRPLGLWRTSAKLAHTLSEVLFICAWSAELSLCFDNYFTSPLQCVPHSVVRWYSDLPPFSNPLGNNTTGDLVEDARKLCSYQRDLIGVVMVALFLYCTNLVISLFRIFEKVKVHQGRGHGRRK